MKSIKEITEHTLVIKKSEFICTLIPLNDENKINEIISVFGYIYRWIGLSILGAGCLLACFLPLIFSNTEFQLSVIYFAYFSYLTTSLIGYFANYKH